MFSTPIVIFLCILIVPVLFVQIMKWVVAPIILHHKQRIAVHPRWEQTRDEQLTPEMRDFISAAVGQFRSEGFTVVANVHQTKGVQGIRAVQILMTDAAGDRVVILATLSATTRTLALAVRSEFADGTQLTSSASPSAGFYPPNPLDQPINARWLRDGRALCEFHRRRLRALGRDHTPRAEPPAVDEVGMVQREWDRELRRYQQIGYNYIDRSGEVCWLTWKGAFLAAWRLTEPLKSRRQRRIESKARREWTALGMDQWQPPAPPAIEAAAAIAADPIAAHPQPAAVAPPPLGPLPYLSAVPPGDAASQLPSLALFGAAGRNVALGYESVLAEGEAQQSWAGEVLTIRLGAPTAGQYAARNWYRLLLPAFLSLMLAVSAFSFYYTWSYVSRRYGGPMSWWRFPVFPLVLAVFIAMDIYKFVVAMRRSRGTMILTASHAGLSFRNAPGKVAEGHLPRDQVEGLLVTVVQLGLIRKTYQLLALLRGPTVRRQVLLSAPNKKVLEQIRLDALQAMGVMLPEEPAGTAAP